MPLVAQYSKLWTSVNAPPPTVSENSMSNSRTSEDDVREGTDEVLLVRARYLKPLIESHMCWMHSKAHEVSWYTYCEALDDFSRKPGYYWPGHGGMTRTEFLKMFIDKSLNVLGIIHTDYMVRQPPRQQHVHLGGACACGPNILNTATLTDWLLDIDGQEV